jgi:hypothetical protein
MIEYEIHVGNVSIFKLRRKFKNAFIITRVGFGPRHVYLMLEVIGSTLVATQYIFLAYNEMNTIENHE